MSLERPGVLRYDANSDGVTDRCPSSHGMRPGVAGRTCPRLVTVPVVQHLSVLVESTLVSATDVRQAQHTSHIMGTQRSRSGSQRGGQRRASVILLRRVPGVDEPDHDSGVAEAENLQEPRQRTAAASAALDGIPFEIQSASVTRIPMGKWSEKPFWSTGFPHASEWPRFGVRARVEGSGEAEDLHAARLRADGGCPGVPCSR